ncbi:MAG: DUF308 domain-containing protein [Gammaproteobacteria bacterium]|nr:DUF308 domain-containing protein [Gammaproteobacteria bacterium]
MTRSDRLMLARLGGDARILCKRTWWVFLAGGIAGLIFGVLAFTRPMAAWLVVATFFAAAILLDGGCNVAGSVQNRDKDGWWIMLLLGYKVRAATEREWILYLAGGLSLLFGILVIVNPTVGGLSVIWMIASWAIVTGVLKIVFACKEKNLPERMANRFV